jgi:hypothetical protein
VGQKKLKYKKTYMQITLNGSYGSYKCSYKENGSYKEIGSYKEK